MMKSLTHPALFFSMMVACTSCAQSKSGPVTYGIHLQLKADNEVFIDDILAGASFQEDADNAAYLLNPFLLTGGKHRIRLKVYPTEAVAGSIKLLATEDANGHEQLLASFPVNVSAGKPTEFSWEVDFKKIPYQLPGWTTGVDLRKEDNNALTKEVLSYYQHLHSLYQNGGHAAELIKLEAKAAAEKNVYNFRDSKVTAYTDKLKAASLNDKVKMEPLEDYQMVIYGNGKLVTLERRPIDSIAGYRRSSRFAHWSALIGHFDDGSGIYQLPVMLYRPAPGAPLERIR
ncbi:hypothetical protein [Chitinophaga qingshengii]|uniref:DUF4843 domain-containing protein n=1 Tax=Chitinophaga qingshengii TaxID=1569794 RepID=A0ABR7TSR0_9BACT|nr:hypothetical protein [Chitinophaga qingshengii]MBC9933503.1 hypothetical protein [Chitinophaga qingshengii]